MTLSHRAEHAAPDETRGLLDKLWEISRSTYNLVALEQFQKLIAINTPETHLAAAMMLVPEGQSWILDQSEDGLSAVMFRPNGTWRYADTPALALIAAIARSIEQ